LQHSGHGSAGLSQIHRNFQLHSKYIQRAKLQNGRQLLSSAAAFTNQLGSSVMNMLSITSASRWVALATCLLLTGQGALAGGHQRNDARLKGVWNVRVNITNCEAGNVPGKIVFASLDALNLIHADGTVLDTNSTNPASRSAHFGYWRHVRGAKYEFAMKFFLFDDAGANTGWRIVRHDLVLSRSGASFSSQGTAETYNTDGVLVATGCSTSTGIRFD
jgi:hypothetical protein